MKFLTADQIAAFHETGILVLKDFYAFEKLQAIQLGIYQVIGQVMIRHGVADRRPSFSPATFDHGYSELLSSNRAWGSEIYDMVKQIPAFMRLVSDPAHELLLRELRPESIPAVAAGGYGIRIDNPFEDKFRAMWHQEYPAQLRSVDGVVYWSPLVPITEEIGPVMMCPGSHKAGPLPVYNADPDRTGRSGAYALKIKDEEEWISRYPKVAPLTNPGDLVVIDFLVLHASGVNRGNRSRWSMQFRYFNFNDPVGRAHGWKGSFAAGVDFRAVHPELFVEA
jgi:hypothetical protein